MHLQCPQCRGPLTDPDPQDSTYVVNGRTVCCFVCYMAAIQGPVTMTATAMYPPPTVQIVDPHPPDT